MERNEDKKLPEELMDEAMDRVAGGDGSLIVGGSDYTTFFVPFFHRNCRRCKNKGTDQCYYGNGVEGAYKAGADPHSTCPGLVCI